MRWRPDRAAFSATAHPRRGFGTGFRGETLMKFDLATRPDDMPDYAAWDAYHAAVADARAARDAAIAAARTAYDAAAMAAWPEYNETKIMDAQFVRDAAIAAALAAYAAAEKPAAEAARAAEAASWPALKAELDARLADVPEDARAIRAALKTFSDELVAR